MNFGYMLFTKSNFYDYAGEEKVMFDTAATFTTNKAFIKVPLTETR